MRYFMGAASKPPPRARINVPPARINVTGGEVSDGHIERFAVGEGAKLWDKVWCGDGSTFGVVGFQLQEWVHSKYCM